MREAQRMDNEPWGVRAVGETLQAESARLREALDILLAFQIQPTADAHGTYTLEKAQEFDRLAERVHGILSDTADRKEVGVGRFIARIDRLEEDLKVQMNYRRIAEDGEARLREAVALFSQCRCVHDAGCPFQYGDERARAALSDTAADDWLQRHDEALTEKITSELVAEFNRKLAVGGSQVLDEVQKAIKAERERCAKIADRYAQPQPCGAWMRVSSTAKEIAVAIREERERCAEEALEFCHCSEHYTERDLIDPTCDCHDIAANIMEA